MKIHRYAAIMSHPEDPEEGLLVHVDAWDRVDAEDTLHDAVDDECGIYSGYDFTLWPEVCDN